MNIRYWIIGLFMLSFYNMHAQTCLHTDLSKKFDYKVTRMDQKDTDGYIEQSIITIEIYNKKDKSLFQHLQFTSNGYNSSNAFSDCNNDRSYITSHNEQADVSDDDYGDIVVADLNFDGKEDIAIKYNVPVDVGPEYYYFIQGQKGFKKDEYLSDKMPFFPWFIKVKKHQLISLAHPFIGTHIYQFQYNPISKKWHKISDHLVWHDRGIEKALKMMED